MTITLRRAAVAALSAIALTLAGCASDSGDSSGGGGTSGSSINIEQAGNYAPTDRDDVQDGGTLTLAISELGQQENPFHANATAYTLSIWKLTNPQVALFDGDGTYHPNPAYITDVSDTEVDGKTQVTYTINEDAAYNDGTPIDWTSFENTWKMNSGETEGAEVLSTDGYQLIESVTPGENDKQAVVTFTQPYAWWQGLFNMFVPPQVNTAELFNTAYLGEIHNEWGAGPFIVDTIDFNTGEVSFVRNDKWWGDPAKLERVTYRQMESQAAINAFKAGEIDASSVADKDRLAVAQTMGDSIEIRGATAPANYLLALNSKTPQLQDVEVRHALFEAIDREQLAEIRFNGLDYTEPLPGSFNMLPTQPGYRDVVGEILTYDQEAAKQRLDAAGWTEGADGVREKDGQRLSVRYVTVAADNAMIKATATAIQKMLSDVGVEVSVEERSTSEFSNILATHDFDIFPMGFQFGDPFGVAYFQQIYGSDSQLNPSGTGSAELDEKIAELQRIPDKDEQIAASFDLEKEALQNWGIIPYANGPDIVAVKAGLVNFGAPGFAVIAAQDVGWRK